MPGRGGSSPSPAPGANCGSTRAACPRKLAVWGRLLTSTTHQRWSRGHNSCRSHLCAHRRGRSQTTTWSFRHSRDPWERKGAAGGRVRLLTEYIHGLQVRRAGATGDFCHVSCRVSRKEMPKARLREESSLPPALPPSSLSLSLSAGTCGGKTAAPVSDTRAHSDL